MKFSFCSCLKRSRARYSISSENIYYINSKSKPSTVILPPSTFLSNVPIVSIESHYEKITDSSGDGEISVNNDNQTAVKLIKFSNSIPSESSQQLVNDDSELYATVNKTRAANNEKRIKIYTTNTNDTITRQDLLQTSLNTSSSSAISTENTYSNRFSNNSQTHPPLPPPLPPLPPQVYIHTVMNDRNNNISMHRPYYDEIIVRESLQDLNQRLRTENGQDRNEQLLHENYYSSVNSEQETSTGSDLYAEIANNSSSDIVYQSSQHHYYSRPAIDANTSDDSSERYATVLDEQRTAASRIYQDVDSLAF